MLPFNTAGSRIADLGTGDSDDEAADLAAFLLIAGADTIAGTVAAALDLLARHRDWQPRLRQDPSLMPGFIRETLRLAGPLRRLNRRIAVDAIDIGGAAIAPGDMIVLQIDRAHRDPDAFPDPEHIDPSRKGAALLAFGGGAHICQGPLIGALEVEAMVGAAVERFAFAPTTERGHLLAHADWRVFTRLPLALEPAPPA
nr:cytochrome P450 [Ancylobacter sp. Lp-2]